MEKRDSDALKGIGILLMIFHHLFGFQERMPTDVRYEPFIVKGIDLFVLLPFFAKICVSLFLLLAGYGLGASSRNGVTFRSWIDRLRSFCLLYWVNLAVLVAISVAGYRWLGGLKTVQLTWHELEGNLLFFRPSYCGEWWFARLYVACIVLVWPALYLFRNVPSLYVCAGSLALWALSGWVKHWAAAELLLWQPCFVLGFLWSRDRWQILPRREQLNLSLRLLTLAIIPVFVLTVALARLDLDHRLDFLFVIPFTGLSVTAVRFLPVHAPLAMLGKFSGHMWLNHTFLFYQLWPSTFYVQSSRALTLVLVVCSSLGLALVSARLLQGVEAGLSAGKNALSPAADLVRTKASRLFPFG